MNAESVSYIVDHATFRSRLLGATAGFLPDDVEDARQDLLLDCLRRSRHFDGARGDWRGFVRGVMRNEVTVVLARRHRRACREIPKGDLSGPEEEPAWDRTVSARAADPREHLAVSIDVRHILRGLSPDLQTLAWLLVGMTVVEACVTTGKSRSRIYQMIRQLRAAFIAAGYNPRGSRQR